MPQIKWFPLKCAECGLIIGYYHTIFNEDSFHADVRCWLCMKRDELPLRG